MRRISRRSTQGEVWPRTRFCLSTCYFVVNYSNHMFRNGRFGEYNPLFRARAKELICALRNHQVSDLQNYVKWRWQTRPLPIFGSHQPCYCRTCWHAPPSSHTEDVDSAVQAQPMPSRVGAAILRRGAVQYISSCKILEENLDELARPDPSPGSSPSSWPTPVPDGWQRLGVRLQKANLLPATTWKSRP